MIRVLIAEDVVLLRNGIKTIVELDTDIHVVAMASNGKEAVEQYRRCKPDVILMDIRMPLMDGIEATRLIKSESKEQKIIIITSFQDAVEVEKAMEYGADGYVLKDMDQDELINTIRSTVKGLNVIHKDVFNSIRKKYCEANKENAYQILKNDQSFNLTDREKELIQLIVQGKKNKEIADALFITEGTVRNMTSKLLEKLKLDDRTQLAIFAVKNRMVDLSKIAEQ